MRRIRTRLASLFRRDRYERELDANTAIVSVVNGVLLRPLPYKDGNQLVVLRQQRPLSGVDDTGFSYKEIVDYRTQALSLDNVVEFHNICGSSSWGARSRSGCRPAWCLRATSMCSVYSHAYWKRSFGGDPQVVGTVFQMNDRPHQVIGVLPPVPQYPLEVDVYMPTSACPFRSAPGMIEGRNARMMVALARMKEGVTLEKSQANLAVVAARLQQSYPDFYPKAQGYPR